MIRISTVYRSLAYAIHNSNNNTILSMYVGSDSRTVRIPTHTAPSYRVSAVTFPTAHSCILYYYIAVTPLVAG